MMLDDPTSRIRLTKALYRFIKSERKVNNKTSAEVATSAGHGQSWVAQIENGKTSTIRSDDLVNLFKGIWGMDDYKEVAALLVQKLQQLKSLSSATANPKPLHLDDTEKTYDKFILSDMATVFKKEKEAFVEQFNALYKQAPSATIKILDTIIQNMQANPDFQMGIFSIPFHMIAELGEDEYAILYDEISELFLKRINKDEIRVSVENVAVKDADKSITETEIGDKDVNEHE